MIHPLAVIQVKAWARQEGALLAILWIVGMVTAFTMPGSFMPTLCFLSTPFVVWWRTREFRDQVLDGVISFRRTFAFVIMSYFYASLLLAFFLYIWLRFVDSGQFFEILSQAVKMVEQTYVEQGVPEEDVKFAVDSINSMTPINWAVFVFTYSLGSGFLLAPFVSLICQRRTKM